MERTGKGDGISRMEQKGLELNAKNHIWQKRVVDGLCFNLERRGLNK